MTFAFTEQTFQAIDGSNYTPNLVEYQMVFNLGHLFDFKHERSAHRFGSHFVHNAQWSALSRNTLVSGIGPWYDPVTWYKVAQWDFQNKITQASPLWPAFVLEVPLCNLRLSMCDCVPSDRIVRKGLYSANQGMMLKDVLHIIEWVLGLSIISIYKFYAAGGINGKAFYSFR